MTNKIISRLFGSPKPFRLGLVLSGGGARGFAHLGALKALEEHRLKPDVISGVSAGSIVGAFYCSGFSPEEIFQVLKARGILQYSNFQLPRNGLLSLTGLRKVLEENLRQKNLEDLPLPLVIAASNFNLGQIEYFRKGKISDLVLASSSIPILFSPVTIGNHQYVDGGLYDNLPVSPIREKCRQVIGINANPIDEEYGFKNLIQVAVRTFHLSVAATVQRSKNQLDRLVEPDELANYEILDSRNAREIFEIGYQSTIKALDD